MATNDELLATMQLMHQSSKDGFMKVDGVLQNRMPLPATPTAATQMVVMKTDGSVATQPIPSGSVSATETAAGSGLFLL